MKVFSIVSIFVMFFNGLAAKADSPTFEWIQSQIESKADPVMNLEGLLRRIQKTYPEYLAHFTLMRSSRSRQEAAPDSPRAIVFGEDARLIITFNGNPSQKGYYLLESIEFKKNRFEFREIRFSEDGERPKISLANPAECMQCHRSSLRPLWDAYEIWDGAYGKRDDAIIDFVNNKYAYRGQKDELIAEHKAELADFKKFQSVWSTHPRFAFLKRTEGSAVAPYSEDMRGKYQFRPNLELTTHLAKYQAIAVVDEMQKSKGCFAVEEARALYGLFRCAGDDAGYASLEKFGFHFDSFSLAITPEKWRYFEGKYYLEDLVAENLRKNMIAREPGLSDYSPVDGYETRRDSYGTAIDYDEENRYEDQQEKRRLKACELLSKRVSSERDSKRVCDSERAEHASLVPNTAKMCATCHEDAKRAPLIEITNRAKLDKATAKLIWERVDSNDPSTRMPPTRSLNPIERSELAEYLKDVK